MQYLSISDFSHVIKSTPLVSIDLLVYNASREYLIGLRNNSPAKSFFFLPGGRIMKSESLDAAFQRITNDELGVKLFLKNAFFNCISHKKSYLIAGTQLSNYKSLKFYSKLGFIISSANYVFHYHNK